MWAVWGGGGAGNYWEAIKHVEDMGGGVGRSGGGGEHSWGVIRFIKIRYVTPIILWRMVWRVWASGSRRQGGQGHLHAGGQGEPERSLGWLAFHCRNPEVEKQKS